MSVFLSNLTQLWLPKLKLLEMLVGELSQQKVNIRPVELYAMQLRSFLRTLLLYTTLLRYLQTLEGIAEENNSTIIFPVPVDVLTRLMKPHQQDPFPSVHIPPPPQL